MMKRDDLLHLVSNHTRIFNKWRAYNMYHSLATHNNKEAYLSHGMSKPELKLSQEWHTQNRWQAFV